MGKGRKRNKGRAQRRQSKLRDFNAQSLQRCVEEDFAYEDRAAKQKEYRERIAALERDILSRTVFVSNVLDFRNGRNSLEQVKLFFEREYGPVKTCQNVNVKNSKSNYPRVRVQFLHQQDAEKIFSGQSLVSARKTHAAVKVSSQSVGYRGVLVVKPTFKYPNMIDEQITEENIITLATESLSLGHWLLADEDAFVNSPLNDDQNMMLTDEWLEEWLTGLAPILRINLRRTLVEIDFTHCRDFQGGSQDDIISSLRHSISDMGLVQKEELIASFRFKDMKTSMHLRQLPNNPGIFELLFSLKCAPKLYSKITDVTNVREFKTRCTSLSGIDGKKYGQCLGFKLCIRKTDMENLSLKSRAVEKLESFGVFQNIYDSLYRTPSLSVKRLVVDQRQMVEFSLEDIVDERISLYARSLLDTHHCTWYHALNNCVVTADGSEKNIFQLIRSGVRLPVEMTLGQMCGMFGQTRFPAHLFHAIYQQEIDEHINFSKIQKTLPSFYVEVPRALITPCCISVTGFQVEMSNRVIRKFVKDHGFTPESFLRVAVGDENGDKLFPDDLIEWRQTSSQLLRNNNGPVARRVQSLLMSGFVINGKEYQFLGCSSSQLKEVSLWMVHPTGGWTIQRMRASMGDFSMCKTPSKFIARMGQCFSTTIASTEKLNISTNSSQIRVKDDLPDIESIYHGNKMCHSDGAGLIRKELLENIVRNLPFAPAIPSEVSAIQIRYGGAKGVLTAWDFSSVCNAKIMQSYDVCLRPSMVKFHAPYTNLEIISVGKHVPYYLNRNVVLLLRHHGVPDAVFLEMQAQMFEDLNSMLFDAQMAAHLVPRLAIDSHLSSFLVHMLSCGMLPNRDPFLYSCLHAIRAHHLMNARKKARIFVDKGAVLIGAIDELGIIPEGHVFLQICKSHTDTNSGFEPVVGPVLVTKHPVMHPGDVRMLIGVDFKELRGHKNVLLFSHHGQRPEADKMAGSDLDGDQFAVTWDKRLFLVNGNVAPMDYSPSNALPEKLITDLSLVNHLIGHAKADNLGRIAMLWLDHAADKKDAGCDECLKLAALHSTAVDFPKSGVPAVIPRELVLSRLHERAHWRERKDTDSFHCNSILGQLYDSVIDEIRSMKTSPGRSPGIAGRHCDKNGQILVYGSAREIEQWKIGNFDAQIPLLLSSSSDERLQFYANEQRGRYEQQLIDLMNKYNIKSEGEIVTGCILKYHKLHKRRRHDVSEEIRRQYRELRLEFRAEFFRMVYRCCLAGNTTFLYGDDGGSHDNAIDKQGTDGDSRCSLEVVGDDEQLEEIEKVVTSKQAAHFIDTNIEKFSSASARSFAYELAAAYYISAYSPEMHWTGNSRCVFYSFPWIIADVIANGINDRDN